MLLLPQIIVNNVVKDCSGFKDSKFIRLDRFIPGKKAKLLVKRLKRLVRFIDCRFEFNSSILANNSLLSKKRFQKAFLP